MAFTFTFTFTFTLTLGSFVGTAGDEGIDRGPRHLGTSDAVKRVTMKDRNEERPRDQATVAIKAPYLRAELAVTASGGLTKPSWPSRSAVVSSSTHKRRAERRAGPVGERCREAVIMT
jgi:hypothetical protein